MTSEGGDGFEELRRANPVPPVSVAELGRSARGEGVLRNIIESETASARPSRSWRKRRVLVPAVLAVALASAGAGYELSRPVRRPLEVACYTKARTGALAFVVSSTGGPPAAACRPLWRSGPISHQGAPPLFTCVLASGAPAVFPSETGSPCARLGLAKPVGASAPPASLEVLQRLLRSDELRAKGCLGVTTARVDAEKAIAASGLRHWHVEVGARGPTLHCAGYGLDPVGRVVHVVAQPRT